MSKFLIIFILLFTFFCCQEKTDKNDPDIFEVNTTDTFRKDIPEWANTLPNELYHEQLTNLLKLKKITSGVKGFEMRIWASHNPTDSMQLVQIKNDEDKWTANFYKLFVDYNEEEGEIRNVHAMVQTKIPKSNWIVFIDSLIGTGIGNLKDFSTFPEYYIPTHSNIITVEIADSNLYRLYEYPAFDYYKKKFKDLLKLEKAISLIESEFDWKLYSKN